jgi:hypothetical protein
VSAYLRRRRNMGEDFNIFYISIIA